jgi:hypothetical protein
MAKVKMVSSWCILMLLLITVALMAPAIAEAKSITIWPDQLKPANPNNDYWQDVSIVRGGSFYAPLKLPLGARITKITYYHLGMGSEAYTSLMILCTKMGDYPDPLGSESSTDTTEKVVAVEVVLSSGAIIRAGYRYYVFVESLNYDSHFMGVKITYRE